MGTSELTFFKVVIWFACISFWESKDTAVGSSLNFPVSLGEAITTTSSISMTFVVSLGRVLIFSAKVVVASRQDVMN